ncbi:multicopper oxidase domain-containing protein [Streptomyces sp. AM 2-1-1]|uniref:multicopper oxidase family protein n=1 Tax=Streptomyces sp. AM 2-1-1 TaxID=3028709 RepID=UPI0023BA1363|nr:multicopper oxidase domain-containing protein [Streptomyces sp. AM 2-1-1]WEH42754.1 multicopper oxidase domain-containing protein [Streptomyces sp. AM 2-1-1]
MDSSRGISRRAVLAAAPALATGVLRAPGASAAALPLGRPPLIGSADGVLSTTLRVAFTRGLLPGVGEVDLRLYNGYVNGPTLRVRPGDVLDLEHVNDLPPNPDQTSHGDHNVPHTFNTFNFHTHGLHVSPAGEADNVFREFTPYDPANGLTVTRYRSRIEIPADHQGGTFWYHSHVHGASAVHLSGGLLGALVVEGAIDRVPQIAAASDIVMCVAELKLKDGRVPELRAENDLAAVGSTFVVNGVYRPVIRLRVGEVQRWRLINASAFTFLPIRVEGHALHQIAMDGIALTRTVERDRVTLSMGNRADVMIKAQSPGDYRVMAGEVLLATVTVVDGTGAEMELPTDLPGPAPYLDPLAVTRRRSLTFHSDQNVFPGQPFPHAFRITGDGATPAARDAADPADPAYGRFDPTYVNHTLRLGETEEWTLRNDSTGHSNHPFHLHTNHFLVTAVDGRPLATPVWQDTVGINRGGSVTIRVRFDDFTGRALVHCHQLQHEDRGMMQLVEYVD